MIVSTPYEGRHAAPRRRRRPGSQRDQRGRVRLAKVAVGLSVALSTLSDLLDLVDRLIALVV